LHKITLATTFGINGGVPVNLTHNLRRVDFDGDSDLGPHALDALHRGSASLGIDKQLACRESKADTSRRTFPILLVLLKLTFPSLLRLLLVAIIVLKSREKVPDAAWSDADSFIPDFALEVVLPFWTLFRYANRDADFAPHVAKFHGVDHWVENGLLKHFPVSDVSFLV